MLIVFVNISNPSLFLFSVKRDDNHDHLITQGTHHGAVPSRKSSSLQALSRTWTMRRHLGFMNEDELQKVCVCGYMTPSLQILDVHRSTFCLKQSAVMVAFWLSVSSTCAKARLLGAGLAERGTAEIYICHVA